MKKTLLSFVTSLLLVGSAYADLYTGGAGMTISDGNPGGLSSGTLSVSTPNGLITSFDDIIIEISTTHTWVGDVTMTLQSPTGTTVQLMRRPGTGGVGNSGDWLVGTHTFVESGGTAIPTVGDMAGGTTWTRSNNSTSTQLTPPIDTDTFASFIGQNPNGVWTLFALDSAGGDTGAISRWSMNISAVPEPGSFAMLSVLGLAGLIRRRIRS